MAVITSRTNEHQFGFACEAAIEPVAQETVSGTNNAGHQPMPLPGVGSIPFRPLWLDISGEANSLERGMRGIEVGADTVVRLHQVRMRVEAGVKQRKRHAAAGKSRVGMEAKGSGQCSEGSFGVEGPSGLDLFV